MCYVTFTTMSVALFSTLCSGPWWLLSLPKNRISFISVQLYLALIPGTDSWNTMKLDPLSILSSEVCDRIWHFDINIYAKPWIPRG